MECVDGICDLLQSHQNRDKVVALTSYVLKLWGASSQSEELMKASARLVGARASLRLFDDAAAVKALVGYGLGKQDGSFWGPLGTAGSTFTLAYLQAEKVVWLLDTGLLTLPKDTDQWCRTMHKLFWSLSSFVGLVRSVRALHASAEELNSPKNRKCSQARFMQASLMTTKLIFDVLHSVSWLPEGWLWGSRLTAVQSSSIATASAVLALVIHYNGKRLLPVKRP